MILESHSSAFIRQLEIKTTSVKPPRPLIVLKVNHLLRDKVISRFAAECCSVFVIDIFLTKLNTKSFLSRNEAMNC